VVGLAVRRGAANYSPLEAGQLSGEYDWCWTWQVAARTPNLPPLYVSAALAHSTQNYHVRIPTIQPVVWHIGAGALRPQAQHK